MSNPDSSNKVDSVDYKAVACTSLRVRGSSESGIWLISRPGFGILKETGDGIRDCDYGRDTGFGDFNKLESGNVAIKKPGFGNSRD